MEKKPPTIIGGEKVEDIDDDSNCDSSSVDEEEFKNTGDIGTNDALKFASSDLTEEDHKFRKKSSRML